MNVTRGPLPTIFLTGSRGPDILNPKFQLLMRPPQGLVIRAWQEALKFSDAPHYHVGTIMKILYVEDNPGDVRLLQYEFAERAPSIEIEWASTYAEAVERLSRATFDQPLYDLVLTDMNLPDGNGISLLSFLQEHGLPLPLVVITGLGDEESAVSALKAGACDYVVKHNNYLSNLPDTLETALHRHRTETSRHTRPLRLLYGSPNMQDIESARKHFSQYAPFILIDSASSAQEVLHRFSLMKNGMEKEDPGRPCDVLLLDFQLPGMTAIELLKDLRQSQHIDVPVVIISGEGNQEIAVQALRLGADDYIAKNRGYLFQLPSVLENAFNRVQVERERAALKASEEHFRMLIENASDLIYVNDKDGRSQYSSPSIERVLGYTTKEAVGTSVFQYAHPDDLPEAIAFHQRTISNPGVTCGPLVVRARHKDGTWRFLELLSKCTEDASGSGKIVANARDVTERIEAEGALQESEAKYRRLVENSLVGVFIIQDGIFRFVNKRFSEIIGCTSDEVLERTDALGFVHPEDRKRVEEDMRRLTLSQIPIVLDFRLVRQDGNYAEVKTFISPILYQGKPAASGMMINTTREKTLEKQLRQAQRMEAIGILAGGIAHDFNNILTALTGYATLLKMENEEDGQLRMSHLEAILSASQKAASLTQSLLAFSRQQSITLNPVNLNEIVQGTEKLLRRLLTEDIVLQTNLSSDVIMVLADTSQMDQILFNLAVNAGDAMPNGGILTLETKIVELDRQFADIHGLPGPGPYALLSVSDTGIGMEEVTRDHIFEPFFTTKEVGKGTGLGLSTVYGIVKQHNGCITVYSEKGKGTVFHLHLPVTDMKEVKEDPSPPPKGGTETILLAEDDDMVRSLMADVLKQHGYRVIEAVDGEEAVDLFQFHGGMDLVILDSVMPKKNGRQVYDEISATHQNIKVLFTSGYTRDVVLDKGIEDKKFDFISKPVSLEAFLRTVREVLDR